MGVCLLASVLVGWQHRGADCVPAQFTRNISLFTWADRVSCGWDMLEYVVPTSVRAFECMCVPHMLLLMLLPLLLTGWCVCG